MKFAWSERPWCNLPGAGRVAEVTGVVFSIPGSLKDFCAYTLVWAEGESVPRFVASGRLETYTDRQYPEVVTVTPGGRMGVSPGRLAVHGAEWELTLSESREPVLTPGPGTGGGGA